MRMMQFFEMTLDRYLSLLSLTNAEFASLVNVDATSISRLRRGLFDPKLDLMRRIWRASGGAVSPNDFATAIEFAPTPRPSREAVQ
jgi:predicted transcriptional regulator